MSELMITVAVASLVGSLHCVGMCGSFVAFYAAGRDGTDPSPWVGHIAYSAGRWLVYATMGALAGLVGSALNLASEASGIRQGAAFICGGLMVVTGMGLLATASGFRLIRIPLPLAVNAALGRILTIFRRAPTVVRGAVLGMSSTLLPCGWLYGFAVVAAGTGTPTMGAAVMTAFWLGTLPAMLSVGFGVQRVARIVGPRLGLLMPCMLIALGLVTVAQRGAISSIPPTAHTCGEHAS
ncbi:MAG: sulfite exporter TauE/SafE family protein [Myxococcota bacterium]